MRFTSAIALAITITLWGCSYSLAKIGFGEIPPLNMAFLRAALSLPLLIPVAYYINPDIKRVLKNWKVLLILGFYGAVAYQVLQNYGLTMTSASESSVLLNSDPIFIALLASLYLKEKLSPRQWAGIAMSFAGVSIIVLQGEVGSLSLTPMNVLGDILAVGGAFAWALFSVYGKKLMAKVNAYDLTAYSALFGAMILAPFALGVEGLTLPSTMNGWGILLFLGIGSSGLAYLLWFVALHGVSAYEAGISLFFTPMIAIMMATMFFGEHIDLLFGIGAAVTILGMLITTRRK